MLFPDLLPNQIFASLGSQNFCNFNSQRHIVTCVMGNSKNLMNHPVFRAIFLLLQKKSIGELILSG